MGEGKGFIGLVEGECEVGGLIDYKKLESIRGFLLYLARTYTHMKPYMKGLHLTIDGWREDRDGEG